MQGQRSAIGSLPDSINFDYGSPTSNVGVDQQICWNNHRNPAESRLSDYRISGSSSSDILMGGVTQEGRNFSRWSIGESSSSNPPNIVSYDMNQIGWPASMNGSVGVGLRLDEQRYEPTNFVSHARVNLNLGSNPDVGGPSLARSTDADSASQNHDLNNVNFHGIGDDMHCPNSSNSIAFENNFFTSARSSSDPFASSSRSGGFLVEEDEGRSDCTLDGRRLSCKRKTLEGNPGQSSSSGSFFSRAAEGGMWQADPPRFDASGSVNASISSDNPSICSTERVNPRLGLAMGGGLPADSPCPLSVPGGPQSSQRNYRLRMNPSMHQDSVPNNSLPSATGGGTRRPDNMTARHPLRFVPMSPPLDLMSPIPSDSSIPPSQPMILRVPALRRSAPAHRWNGTPTLRPGSSSSSAVYGERDAALPEDVNSINQARNVAEHPMFIPSGEARNPPQHSTRWSVSSGNVGGSRNFPSSSRTGPVSASHTAPGPSWALHRQSSSQYSHRLTDYVRRSLLSTVGSESAGQGSNNGQLRPGPTSSQEGIPSSGGNQGRNQSSSRSALWIERQGDGAVGIPYSLRALAAAGEGRSRLVSEFRNVLEMMRRGEGLRFEDIMILDQSMLFGITDVHDQHRDMRLDVDNMSYEELLALEERIGNVCTGLSEDTILNRMKQRKYIHTMSDDQIDSEPCCICQEVYNDGEGLGTLDCGHDFHSECIKQWLTQKNLCPICKTTALST